MFNYYEFNLFWDTSKAILDPPWDISPNYPPFLFFKSEPTKPFFILEIPFKFELLYGEELSN